MLASPRALTLRIWQRSSRTRGLRCHRAIMASAVSNSAQQPTHEELIEKFKVTVPALDGSNYKGQHGKLGVIGGCSTYTGAPFYAAQSAHKVGADMTFVICTPSAAPIIKGFTPDMIALPFLLEDNALAEDTPLVAHHLSEVMRWLPRMTSLVVGPGLGTDPAPSASAAQIIRWARESGLPLVIDGSGISTVVEDPSLIQGYKRCVLTPNMAELGRLASAVSVVLPGSVGQHWQAHVQEIAQQWQGPVVVSKGPRDVISDGQSHLVCDLPGSLKRCGGIGDLLAGSLGTFLGWQYPKQVPLQDEPSSEKLMIASYAACVLLRTASKTAFTEHGRALGAGDILPALPAAFKTHFGP